MLTYADVCSELEVTDLEHEFMMLEHQFMRPILNVLSKTCCVMKDIESDLEETEVSHTLGGVQEGHVQVRGKWRGCKLSVTLLSGTLYSLGLAEVDRRARFRL